ncbi:unnamed protein product [Rhizophagus irregularis]|nr:unnamed protein product [Rhizophagus irregularis]
MKFLSKRVSNYTSFHSDLDSTKHGRSSGGVSLFIHNSLATHVQFYESHSSRILYRSFNFPGNFNMNLEKYYPIYMQQPQADSQRVHRLFYHLLSHNYEDCTPVNSSPILGTYHHLETITCIDFKCEYLHSRIIKAAKSKLPSVTVGNTYTSKKPKDLESLIQSYRFLSKVAKTIRLLHRTPILYSSRYVIRLNNILLTYRSVFTASISLPSLLNEGRHDDFISLLKTLEDMTLLLRGLLLLKEKEFQATSIQAKIDARNDNFTNDISTFIESALSRTRRCIILDRVFVDHPTQPTLLTSPDAIHKEVIDHFQNFVPITSSPPSSIRDLPKRWSDVYEPLVDVSSKAPGPSMISYEMLKHLGPHASTLLLNLVGACLSDANIPDLWRQATVFPIPKPHEWKCQLKNTRPITLLEVIRKTLVKLCYNPILLGYLEAPVVILLSLWNLLFTILW